MKALDALAIEAGAFYVMDRGYLDFGRLHRFTLCLAFFVIRGKKNLDYNRRSYRRVEDDGTSKRSDDRPEWPQELEGLPRTLASDRLLRPGDQEAIRLLDQQLPVASINNLADLQISMANRVVLPMDQAKLENQILLWEVS